MSVRLILMNSLGMKRVSWNDAKKQAETEKTMLKPLKNEDVYRVFRYSWFGPS